MPRSAANGRRFRAAFAKLIAPPVKQKKTTKKG